MACSFYRWWWSIEIVYVFKKNAISTLLWNPCRLLFGFVDFYSCFLTKYDAAVRLSKLGLPRGFKLNWAHSFNIMQNFVSPNTWFFIHFWLCFVDFYYFVDFYSSWWLDQTTIPVATNKMTRSFYRWWWSIEIVYVFKKCNLNFTLKSV